MTEARTYTGLRGEVQQVLHQTSALSTVLQLDYTYDSNHDRLFERYGGAGSAGDAFAYDRMRRLTTAWIGSATPASPAGATYVKKIDYVMDDDGSRSSVVVTPWGGAAGSTPYTTNNLNQYTAVGTTTRLHDLNGNLKADGQFVYKYDYRNQLIEVRTATGSLLVASYLYDPAGRRVEKTVFATGLIERYVYSGLETVSVYDGANGWRQDFVFGDVIDQVVMLQQRDVLDYDGDQDTSEVVRHYYHRNALGSVMEITDPAQASAVSYRYDPYGKVTITRGGQVQATDPLGQPWMFTARFFDGETGLYYYRARAYDPVTGRFLQRDPLGQYAEPNVYTYCLGSPTNLSDPFGLEPEKYVAGKPKDVERTVRSIFAAMGVPANLLPSIDQLASVLLEDNHSWETISYSVYVPFSSSVTIHCNPVQITLTESAVGREQPGEPDDEPDDSGTGDSGSMCTEYKFGVSGLTEYKITFSRKRTDREDDTSDYTIGDLIKDSAPNPADPTTYLPPGFSAILSTFIKAEEHGEFIADKVVPRWTSWSAYWHAPQNVVGSWWLHKTKNRVPCDPEALARGRQKVSGTRGPGPADDLTRCQVKAYQRKWFMKHPNGGSVK